jgi:hypothetical protein
MTSLNFNLWTSQVTALGGTQGPNDGGDEIVCQVRFIKLSSFIPVFVWLGFYDVISIGWFRRCYYVRWCSSYMMSMSCCDDEWIGGGFSTYYNQRTWQSNQISSYFTSISSSPNSGFNSEGRGKITKLYPNELVTKPMKSGYPDVSIIATQYRTVITRKTYELYGTSASAPVFAAMSELAPLFGCYIVHWGEP